MAKNNRGAALPYALKMANISKRMVGTANTTHIDNAIVIFFLAAKRLLGFRSFLPAAVRFSLFSSCPVSAAADALLAIVWVFPEFLRKDRLIVCMSDVAHFTMIRLATTTRNMKAPVATTTAACDRLAAARIVATAGPMQNKP